MKSPQKWCSQQGSKELDRYFFTYSSVVDSTPAVTYQRIDTHGWVVGVIEIYRDGKVLIREAGDRYPLSIGPVDADELADFDEGDYKGNEIEKEQYQVMWNAFVSLGQIIHRTI